MKNQKSFAWITLLLLSSMASSSRADLILTITGEDSDSIVQWSLEGSFAVNQAIAAQNNNDLLFPTQQTNGWDHLLTAGTDGVVASKTIGHASISGSPTISINGGGNLFAGIGLNNFAFLNNGGGDTFQVLFDGFAVHPALSNGDTVTYGGSGAMNLGAAKSTVFQDGIYIGEPLLHAADRFRLVIQSEAVPEPTNLGLSALGIGMGLIRRRRRMRRMPAK